MTAQTFTKPVVTIPRRPRPTPRYEGLFLEPAYAPVFEEDDEDETETSTHEAA